jgi:hypothetical protein
VSEDNKAAPFNGDELMGLLRGLERRKIAYQIDYRRTSESCDGLMVRILGGLVFWEVGFYDYDHIEVVKFVLAGDAETGVTAASLLSELDDLRDSR